MLKLVRLNDRNCLLRLGYLKDQSLHEPLLFNIFINDLISSESVIDLVMYADGTTLESTLEAFGDRRDPGNIQRNINSELAKI